MAIDLNQLKSVEKDFPKLRLIMDNNMDDWGRLTYIQLFYDSNYIGILREPEFAGMHNSPVSEFVPSEETRNLTENQYKGLIERIMKAYVEKQKTKSPYSK